jgi:four helix bundle protein
MLRANPDRLLAYQVAETISIEVVSLARRFRGPGAFERADQLVRAACSVSSNIAEACGRGTIAEFRQFLMYARASAQEVRTQLRIAKAVEPRQRALAQLLENRATLVIKLITRLHGHPPPQV